MYYLIVLIRKSPVRVSCLAMPQEDLKNLQDDLSMTQLMVQTVYLPPLPQRPGYDPEQDVPDGHLVQAFPCLYISPPM